MNVIGEIIRINSQTGILICACKFLASPVEMQRGVDQASPTEKTLLETPCSRFGGVRCHIQFTDVSLVPREEGALLTIRNA